MHRTKFKYENQQRAITQKTRRQELWFMCTALPLDEIYPPTKLHNHSKYSLQRAITQKISKQELLFMCIALFLDEIYPPTKFHNHS